MYEYRFHSVLKSGLGACRGGCPIRIKITQWLIGRQLHKAISFEVVRALRTNKFKDSREALGVAKIIYKLCKSFGERRMSKQMKHFIRKDASSRILDLARTHAGEPHAWKIYFLSYCLNPHFLHKTAMERISGLFQKAINSLTVCI